MPGPTKASFVEHSPLVTCSRSVSTASHGRQQSASVSCGIPEECYPPSKIRPVLRFGYWRLWTMEMQKRVHLNEENAAEVPGIEWKRQQNCRG